MAKRTSMGRQKMEMKKIEDEEALQVCFSKRRAGVFKKASELCILCGVDIALVIFSPAGKAYSFGHPSVDAVIDRFLLGPAAPPPPPESAAQAHRAMLLQELHRQHADAARRLEEEVARRDRLKEIGDAGRRVNLWWGTDLDKLEFAELEKFYAALRALKQKVIERRARLAAPPPPPPVDPTAFLGGDFTFAPPAMYGAPAAGQGMGGSGQYPGQLMMGFGDVHYPAKATVSSSHVVQYLSPASSNHGVQYLPPATSSHGIQYLPPASSSHGGLYPPPASSGHGVQYHDPDMPSSSGVHYQDQGMPSSSGVKYPWMP